jgi:hypothetical protein
MFPILTWMCGATYSAMNNHIVRVTQRKQAIAQAASERHTAVRRAAEALSQRTIDQATAELLNEALARLCVLCYERDESGRLCNVDAATGRVLVPLPWGKLGFAKWGLTASEGDAMRAIMLTRQREGLPLFHFDRSRRSWFLNVAEWPDGAQVLGQMKEWEITAGEYRAARGNGG